MEPFSHLEPVVREVDGEVGEGADGVEGGKVDGAESVVGDVERLQPVDVLEGLVLQLLNLNWAGSRPFVLFYFYHLYINKLVN